MSSSGSFNLRMLFALTLVHFTGDFYSAFISPLFPLFVTHLGISLTQVGIIAGVMRFLAFIVQPPVGYLADRHPTRAFLLVGLGLTVVFIPLSGMATGFWTLLLAVSLGSFGSSMFHPPATGMVPVYAGHRAGFAMSVFNTGGTLAFGLGPLFVTWYAVRFGLEALPFTMILGLASLVWLFLVVPVPPSEELRSRGFVDSLRQSLGAVWKGVAVIWAAMFLRAVVGQSFITFLPVWYVGKGYSAVSAGFVVSLFTVAGTVSGLLAGMASDRVGFKPVFFFTHGLMAPVLWLLLHSQGGWVYAGAALAGGMSLATLPVAVVMAQTLAPRGRSMVASLMMGFAYGLGGLVSPLVGWLADTYSVQSVLGVICFLPIATLPLIWRFPHVETPGQGSGRRPDTGGAGCPVRPVDAAGLTESSMESIAPAIDETMLRERK